jgi:Predicted aminopeptidases
MKYFIITAVSLFILGAGLVYLIVGMPGKSFRGPLPPLNQGARTIRSNLEAHISYLAGEIGVRNYLRPEALQQAAAYIESTLRASGYAVEIQMFGTEEQPFMNVQAELPGSSHSHEIIVLGAHYDTVAGSPGADDNASGVAGLLELARLLKGVKLPRTVRFLAFTNEEEPFSHSNQMGSRVYAQRARERNETIVGMISLESIGYYTDQPGSQQYPAPFAWFYPDTGSFLAFVGDLASRNLVRCAISSFRRHARFPSEGVAAPKAFAADIGRSDHASFWAQGYPAIMVTDTVPFRYPHYHRPSDTPDRLKFDPMVRVVIGLSSVVTDLASGSCQNTLG